MQQISRIERKPYPRLQRRFTSRADFRGSGTRPARRREAFAFGDEPPGQGDSLRAEIFLLDGTA
jgi:hypothetical protein